MICIYIVCIYKESKFNVTFLIGADIDTLLVAPRHIERSDFFSTFYDFLKQREETSDVRVTLFFPLFYFCYEVKR